MKRSLKVLVSSLIVLGLIFGLTGCGSSSQEVLKVYNWGDYIDESVIEEFEKEYNIKVIYDQFATNEEMYVKLKNGGAEYDVVIPSDYMISKMISEGMLAKINLDNIPNYKYIDDRFKNLDFDPNNEYSVPYMWGTLGIIYNKKMVNENVDSWDILWDKKYSKNILMMDSQRDAIGVALKKLGYSLNSKDPGELNQAKELLLEQKPLVLAYVGDEVKDKMIGNEAALAVVFSGDAVFMMRENPDLVYVVPKEGSNKWFDSMVIPANAKNKEAAEKFINFMCSTDIAYRNANYIGYSTPHAEAFKLLPEELRNSKVYYPDESDLANCEVYQDLTDVLDIYDKIWTDVKSK